ncbi:MAG: geranylgeranylglyceryl/heptaprenylglyceryl phosphate synthase [Nonlabens sp.]
MDKLYKRIAKAKRTMGILLDPEKLDFDRVSAFAKAISKKNSQLLTKFNLDQILLLVGGSTMQNVDFVAWTKHLKSLTDLPVIIFPGSHDQVAPDADALLFLNLISGRNPDYLIEHQVEAAMKVAELDIEIIPTAYLLLDGGTETAVARISQTSPMDQGDLKRILKTALAGQFMGNQLIYLEAGSGAITPVQNDVVKLIKSHLNIPIIVGGGLRQYQDINDRFNAGAKMIVVGTAIEENLDWI